MASILRRLRQFGTNSKPNKQSDSDSEVPANPRKSSFKFPSRQSHSDSGKASPDPCVEFAHLVSSTAVPNPDELVAIKSAKQACQEDLALCRQQVETQKATPQTVQAAEDKVHILTSLSSSLRQIPPEIFRDIFALAAEPKGIQQIAEKRLSSSPWNLLLVCKDWYGICMSYGSLWSTIIIPRGVSDPRYTAALASKTKALLELQLQRSKDADLTVTFLHRHPGSDFGEPYLDIILPHLHRCISLTVQCHVLTKTFLPKQFPRLQRLILLSGKEDARQRTTRSMLPHPTESMDSETIKFFAAQPNLKTISATILGAPSRLREFAPARLPTLDHVTGRLVIERLGFTRVGAPNDYFLKLVPRMVNVTELKITRAYRLPPSPISMGLRRGEAQDCTSQSLICLPNLRKVSIKGLGVLSLLLSALTAPSLKELSYTGLVKEANAIRLVNFIALSELRLQSFELQTRSPAMEVVSFFRRAPPESWRSLERLVIGRQTKSRYGTPRSTSLVHTSGAPIIRLLTRSTGSARPSAANQDLLPRLMYVKLTGFSALCRQVVDMLQSRRNPGTQQQIQFVDLTGLLPFNSDTPRVTFPPPSPTSTSESDSEESDDDDDDLESDDDDNDDAESETDSLDSPADANQFTPAYISTIGDMLQRRQCPCGRGHCAGSAVASSAAGPSSAGICTAGGQSEEKKTGSMKWAGALMQDREQKDRVKELEKRGLEVLLFRPGKEEKERRRAEAKERVRALDNEIRAYFDT